MDGLRDTVSGPQRSTAFGPELLLSASQWQRISACQASVFLTGENDVPTGNIPHAFAAGFIHELTFDADRVRPLGRGLERIAGGWRLAGIVRFPSGSLIAMIQATNLKEGKSFCVETAAALKSYTNGEE